MNRRVTLHSSPNCPERRRKEFKSFAPPLSLAEDFCFLGDKDPVKVAGIGTRPHTDDYLS